MCAFDWLNSISNCRHDFSSSVFRGNFYRHICLLLLLLPILQSCNTTQFLDKTKGEKYLKKNVIVIEKNADGKVKNRSSLSYELSKLFKQKPNRKFFGVPRQFFYFTAQDTIGKTKFGKAFSRFQGKSLAEEPVYLDTALARETADAMQFYLENRGYFFADVEQQISTSKKDTKATVTYYVQTGRQFKIDTITFVSRDTAIQRILREISNESLLKPGNPIDVRLYDQEVARITRYLRNNGYAFFYPQYITNLEATDSSNVDHTVGLKLEVLTPTGKEKHQKYSVGNIYVYPDFDPASPVKSKPDTLIQGLFFATRGEEFKVKPRTLTNSIYFRTGQTFSQEKVDNSERQLGALGVFRPLIISYEEDTLNAGVLNFYVPLTPTKKWEIGADFDINTTERKGVVGNRNLIGLSFSPSLRNRNFLKGAELLIGNVDFGIELAPFSGRKEIINALDFRLQTDLYFPRFVDYFGLWKGLRNASATGPKFHEKLRQKATSRLSMGYNSLILLNNYRLQFINMSFGYEIPVTVNHRVFLNHFGVDLVIPKVEIGSRFDSLLNDIPSLRNSFSKQFITGLVLRDLNFIYTTTPRTSGPTWYFRGYFDVSGLEIMGANSLYNTIAKKSETFDFFNVEFSHYTKLELDGRNYWNFGPQRSFVIRLNSGIALPYYRSKEVPYVKQFYVGGPYSLRGWYARELGPGLYVDPITRDPRNRPLFYQSGNFKLEFNLEYRFFMMRPLGLFNLYGAFFLDGGNVWTLKEDPARPGAHLALNRVIDENGIITQDLFLNEMALASGFGTRWDFTYFILRLDFGTPVRNNFPDPARGQNYWVDFSKWQFRDIRYQLALGYPF
jgi:outer membrane protein insertion porin family